MNPVHEGQPRHKNARFVRKVIEVNEPLPFLHAEKNIRPALHQTLRQTQSHGVTPLARSCSRVWRTVSRLMQILLFIIYYSAKCRL